MGFNYIAQNDVDNRKKLHPDWKIVGTEETTGNGTRGVCQTIKADGQDLAVITIEVQDSKGRLVLDACPMLNLSLTGEGRILGVGNGDPSYLGSDHPNELDCHQFLIPAFNGLAQVIVQSCHQPSRIQLTCNADRLKDGTISVIAE